VCDLDEFLYSRKGYKTVADYLDTVTSISISSVVVPWSLYGHNNLKQQPDRVVDNFIRRKKFEGKICCKALILREKIRTLDIHTHRPTDGLSVDPLLDRWRGDPSIKVSDDYMESLPLHMNHYVVQSEEWYWNVKVKRGRADTNAKTHQRDQGFFDGHGDGDVVDEELKNKTYHE